MPAGFPPLIPNELLALRQIAERCISLVHKSRNECDLNKRRMAL